ncbi:hypothetical protein [uncultured Brevundimonas sp.]|uniref:hypothetical protein n=1 Tax=uncultured Brevundimonas sp. TaxID=213418 RepID=UPI0026092C9C|nr:hypothetical protein [uncultured Brevundimonas sp.]
MAKARGDRNTHDLFDHERLFPVETPRELENALDFNARVAQAMSRACREAAEAGHDRFAIASRMSDILGTEVTKGMIDAYCSQARETHTISLARFKAFVRASGCLWLWNVVLDGEGVTLMQGEEARHAQASLARKRAAALLEEAKRLERDAPLIINRRRGTR